MPKVIVSKKAAKQLRDLENSTHYEQIKEFIKQLEQTHFPKGYDIRKVKGQKRVIRARFGEHRLFYEVNFAEKKVYVLVILPKGLISK